MSRVYVTAWCETCRQYTTHDQALGCVACRWPDPETAARQQLADALNAPCRDCHCTVCVCGVDDQLDAGGRA